MATPTLTPVEGSKSVAAIGYEEGTIYVQFRSGKTYSYPEQSAETWEALLLAHSKGQFVMRYLAKCQFAEDMDRPVERGLESLTEEASPCCLRAFRKSAPAVGATSWACPACGQEYRARQIDAIRRWEAHACTMRF